MNHLRSPISPLLIEGILQNLDGVISVKAGRVEGLPAGAAADSHNFH